MMRQYDQRTGRQARKEFIMNMGKKWTFEKEEKEKEEEESLFSNEWIDAIINQDIRNSVFLISFKPLL